MKNILILFILLTSNVYADAIPGFLELDINSTYWQHTLTYQEYLNTEIGFKYGVSHNWFQPYIFGNTQNFFQLGENFYTNHPFRDKYSFGFGLILAKTIYIEAGHTCTHRVFSGLKGEKELYSSLPKLRHNHIKVGIKFNID